MCSTQLAEIPPWPRGYPVPLPGECSPGREDRRSSRPRSCQDVLASCTIATTTVKERFRRNRWFSWRGGCRQRVARGDHWVLPARGARAAIDLKKSCLGTGRSCPNCPDRNHEPCIPPTKQIDIHIVILAKGNLENEWRGLRVTSTGDKP